MLNRSSTPSSHQHIRNLENMRDLLLTICPDTPRTEEEKSRKESFEKWLEVYTEASVKLAVYYEVRFMHASVYGFNKVVQRFLHLLRECVVSHQWPQALQLVHTLCNEDRASSAIWKVGLAGLYQDGDRNVTLVDKFAKHVCGLKGIGSQEVLMDCLLFLLVTGNISDAKDLMQNWKREKLLQGPVTMNARRKVADLLFLAYQGLILYTEWKASTWNMGHTEETDMFGLPLSEDMASRTTKFLADGAIEYLTFVQCTPGVWDIFVTPLAEIYQFYNAEECSSLLRSYRDLNPGNPNAHRFLYEWETKNDVDAQTRLDCLKAQVEMDPGNPLALQLYKELVSGLGDQGHALTVLFDYLDFSNPGNPDQEGWELLRTALTSALSQQDRDLHQTVVQLWTCRRDWWPQSKFAKGSHLSKTEKAVRNMLRNLVPMEEPR